MSTEAENDVFMVELWIHGNERVYETEYRMGYRPEASTLQALTQEAVADYGVVHSGSADEEPSVNVSVRYLRRDDNPPSRERERVPV